MNNKQDDKKEASTFDNLEHLEDLVTFEERSSELNLIFEEIIKDLKRRGKF